MLQYFYYIWNLLNSNEKKEIFYHYGKCILAAILFVIIDWQYLIILWISSSYGIQNIIQTIVGVQLFTWLISFWYYYVKYQLSIEQNNYYKLISSKHYDYVLKRISENASYQWLDELSPLELTKNLDATEKGLQHIFVFVTNAVRCVGIMVFSIVCMCISYKECAIIFILFFGSLFISFNRKNIFEAYNKKRKSFQLLNNHNSNIMSDNLYILLDSIFHNTEDKLIENITTLNDKIKEQQIELYDYEDQTYTSIGLIIVSGYIIIIIFMSSILRMSMADFSTFFISALLTYKCVNHRINELCDMYTRIRQTQIDFENLETIWENTRYKRKEYNQIKIDKISNQLNLYNKYMGYHYDNVEKKQLELYNNFIKENNEEMKYNSYINSLPTKQKYLKYKNKDIDEYYNIKNYIVAHPERISKFNNYRNNNKINIKSDLELYYDFKIINDDVKKDKPIYEIKIYSINFEYTNTNILPPPGVKYKNDDPLKFKSNSHILIEGSSGSGKSTFLKIIRGIIPLESNTNNKIGSCHVVFRLNEGNEQLINFNNLSSSICYARQNATSFVGGSVYQIMSDDYINNIDILSDDDVKLMLISLSIACVDYKFNNLNYICNKDTISGGQKQRLTLAKIIYRILKDDKQIIILDEIDAGLDLTTAFKIIINLKLIFKEKLLLVVLHTEELKSLFKNKIQIVDGNIN